MMPPIYSCHYFRRHFDYFIYLIFSFFAIFILFRDSAAEDITVISNIFCRLRLLCYMSVHLSDFADDFDIFFTLDFFFFFFFHFR